MKVLVIGAGNMGLTYSEGMCTSPVLNRCKLMIYDFNKELQDELRKNPLFDVRTVLKESVETADIIFVAVKPYHADGLFKEIKSVLNKEQLIVSLMAGVKIASIQKCYRD